MPTSTKTRGPRTNTAPLERSLRRRLRCQCTHSGTACGRQARFRVTVVCAEIDCESAVHTYLLCADCTQNWLLHAAEDPTAPKLRVTAL